MATSKQSAANRLTDLLGLAPVDISGKQNGTVPALVFRAAARRVGLAHKSRVQTTEAIVRQAGHRWRAHYDSRRSASKGGGNVTVPGLIALARALEAIMGAEDATVSTSLDAGSPGTAQGRQMDPHRRKKIEDAAQEWLMAHYRKRGFDVSDTRVGHPYDAVARKPDLMIFLEAKGTTTVGEKVLVTRNEVAWARANQGRCFMGIWSGMVFTAGGDIDPTQGRKEIVPWDPSDDDLAAVVYEWRFPKTNPA